MSESNSLTSTQNTLIPQSNPPANQQDEISLVDIWKFVARHQKLILGITASITLVGLIAALLIPKKYEYSMVLEIGKTMQRNNGEIEFIPIENPLSVKAKLDSAYLPQAVNEQITDTNSQQAIPKIMVTTPKEGNTVTLSSTASPSDSVIVKSIMQNAANHLVLDLNRVTEVDSAQLQEEIKSAKLELEKLSDNDEINTKLKVEEQKILETKTRIIRLESSNKALEAEINRTEQQEEFYKDQLKLINSQISRIDLQQNKNSLSQKKLENDTSNIFLDIQSQEYITRKASIEEKLLLTIPSLHLNQSEKLKEQQQQVLLEETLLKQQESNLAAFKKNIDRQTQAQKDRIETLVITLNNLSKTKALLEPTQSIKPKGLGKAVIIMLSVFLGLFAGLFAAFIVDLRERVRNAS